MVILVTNTSIIIIYDLTAQNNKGCVLRVLILDTKLIILQRWVFGTEHLFIHDLLSVIIIIIFMYSSCASRKMSELDCQ